MNIVRLCGRGLMLVAKADPLTTAAYIIIIVFLNLLPVFQVWLTNVNIKLW